MRKNLLVLFVIFLFLSSGCAKLMRAKTTEEYTPPMKSYQQEPDQFNSSGQTESKEISYQKTSPGRQKEIAYARKIIKNGYLTIKVKDSLVKLKEIDKLTQEMGGYVVSSSISGTEEKTAQITIKVPQVKFNAALDEISKMGEVISVNTSSEDVTEEYIDLEGRLSNLTVERNRIYEILKMAKNVQEVLLVEKELARIQGEIEQIQGRLKYLKNRTDLATIEVKILGERASTPPKSFWDIGQTFKSAFRAFLSGIKAIVNTLIWIVAYAPIIAVYIILFTILIFLIKTILVILWRSIFKRKK